MENNKELIEALSERTIEYVKTSIELVKLKTLDKAADVISSFVPRFIVFVLIFSLLFFINLGIAFWLGEILGKTYYGFYIVAAFYGLLGIILQFFLHKWVKNIISNLFIKPIAS